MTFNTKRLLKAIEAYVYFSDNRDSEVFKVAEEILIKEMKVLKNSLGPRVLEDFYYSSKGLNGPHMDYMFVPKLHKRN